MQRFLWLIPIVFLFTYFALIFESTGIALLGFTVALFGVLSFAILLYVRKRVDVRLEVPMKVVDAGQEFGLRVSISNRCLFPLKKLVIPLACGESHERKKEGKRLCFRTLPGGNSSESRRLTIEGPGHYEFLAGRVRVYDPFGIFYVTLRKRILAQVLVLPKIREVPIKLGEGVRNFVGEAVSYDDSRAGNDPAEVFGVREFRDGDKPQRVHWKLSARMEDLMVKEDSLPKTCPILLFMPEGAMGENGSLEYLASLSFTLMDQKCAHYVTYHSRSRNDLVRLRVDDEESYYEALTTFMQDGVAESGNERLERYREKYRGEPFLHYVLADGSGRVNVDGAEEFLAKDYGEELLFK